MYTGSLRGRRKVNNKNQPHDNGGLHRTTGGKEMNATKLERKPNHAPEHTGRTAMCLCSETKMCQSCLLLREPASRFVSCGFCLSLSPVIVVFIRRRQRKDKPQGRIDKTQPCAARSHDPIGSQWESQSVSYEEVAVLLRTPSVR